MRIVAALLLEGFVLPGDATRLGDTIRLRRCTAAELRTFAKYEHFAQVEAGTLTVLEEARDYLGEPGDLGAFQRAKERAEEAALILRLSFSGTIGWRLICYSTPEQPGSEIISCSWAGVRNAWAEGTAVVTADGLQHAAALWQAAEPVLSASPWPRLAAALGRFTASYSRRSPADKAIDLAICLEAIAGDKRSREKTRVIAGRVAPLIIAELQSVTEEEAHAAVLRLYSSRNAIVHKAVAGPEASQVLEWKALIRAFLRQCLVRCATGELPDWVQAA